MVQFLAENRPLQKQKKNTGGGGGVDLFHLCARYYVKEVTGSSQNLLKNCVESH